MWLCMSREVGKCTQLYVSESETETSVHGIKWDPFFSPRVRVPLTSAVTTVVLTAAALHIRSPQAWCVHYPSEMQPDYRKTYRVQPGRWNNTTKRGVSLTNKDPNWQSSLSQTLFHLSWLTHLWNPSKRRRKGGYPCVECETVHVDVVEFALPSCLCQIFVAFNGLGNSMCSF